MRGEPEMTYAYFIDNTYNPIPVDNSKLFKYLQIIQLPEDNIITEEVGERTEIQKLFESLKKEDVLIIRSLCDLGDKIHQVLKALEVLYAKKVDLISICEDYYNSTDYIKLVSDLYLFDCDLRERARLIGYEKAKGSGKIGRPKSKGIEEALKLHESRKFTAEQICKMTGISQSTLYRALRDKQANINKDSSS